MLSRDTDFKWGKATEELRVQSKESLTSQKKKKKKVQNMGIFLIKVDLIYLAEISQNKEWHF